MPPDKGMSAAQAKLVGASSPITVEAISSGVGFAILVLVKIEQSRLLGDFDKTVAARCCTVHA